MIAIFELVIKSSVFIIGTIVLLLCFRKIYQGNKAFPYFFYLIYYVFFILPMFVQILFPNHVYLAFVRANEAMNDSLAHLIYDCFCLSFVFIIYACGKKTRKNKATLIINTGVAKVCFLIMVSVFIYTVATNGVARLIPYGSGYKGISNVNEVLVGCCTISFLVILASRPKISKTILICSSILEIAFCWFVGKRYVVAETAIVSLVILALTNQISGKKFILFGIIGSIAIFVFSIIYGLFLKGNYSSLVDYLMVDMSRQYTMVYQIHCFLIGKDISVHRFDSIFYLLTFFIPRSLWSAKPYPFVNQLTYSLISWSDIPSNQNVGWATTCSIFSDLFDSFSFFGLILGFLLFVFLFHLFKRTNKAYYIVALSYLTIKLITVQISSAIIQLVICFVIIFITEKLFNKNAKKILVTSLSVPLKKRA